jgi:putative ABC transport system substrate-binding protein
MNRRNLLILLAGAGITRPLAVGAEQPGMPVIGFLSSASAESFAPLVAAFRDGLKDAGYVEGQNVAIQFAWAAGQYDKLPVLAEDLVRRPVAVIVAMGGAVAALAAKGATSVIPIVISIGDDPVKYGLVTSLRHPGSNITGVTLFMDELTPKRLEFLSEVAPAAALAMLINPRNPNAESEARNTEAAAQQIGRELRVLTASNEGEIDAALANLAQPPGTALMIATDPFFFARRDQLAALAARYAIPTIHFHRAFAAAGGLISYGATITEETRMAGRYTGRILAGDKPGDLPILQPSKIEHQSQDRQGARPHRAANDPRPRRRSDRMRRRRFLAALGGAILAGPIAAIAQQPTEVPRVGILMGASPSDEAARLDAFRGTLEKLGYFDGLTIQIEPRYAMGQPDRFGSLARELAALAPFVIACVGRRETVALQAATRTIPIVFMQVHDPVEMGFVASLARPGGNTTGFTQMGAELDSKRLGLLHEIAPSLSRAAFLVNPNLTPGLQERLAGAEAAAKSLGIGLRRVAATNPAELTAAFAEIEKSSSEALLVQNDPMLGGTEFPRILEFALAHRLPTVFEAVPSIPPGVLLSYGPDLLENARLAAGYVAKILKGAKPADLPVQQPTRFKLIVNLNTAKLIGLTIPPSILGSADEVIE